jgi:hypothetical protein
MKLVKLLLVFVVLILTQQIVLSQGRTIGYSFYSRDGIVEKVEKTKNYSLDLIRTDLDISFEEDVPELTEHQMLKLKEIGSIESSRVKTKGYYENGILWYIPCVEVDSCFLEETNVFYTGPFLKPQQKTFVLWFIFALFGIISMILFQKSNSGFAAVFAAVFAIAVLAVVLDLSTVAAVVAFVGLVAVVVADSDIKKLKFIFAYIYYVTMILASLFAYLQI